MSLVKCPPNEEIGRCASHRAFWNAAQSLIKIIKAEKLTWESSWNEQKHHQNVNGFGLLLPTPPENPCWYLLWLRPKELSHSLSKTEKSKIVRLLLHLGMTSIMTTIQRKLLQKHDYKLVLKSFQKCSNNKLIKCVHFLARMGFWMVPYMWLSVCTRVLVCVCVCVCVSSGLKIFNWFGVCFPKKHKLFAAGMMQC